MITNLYFLALTKIDPGSLPTPSAGKDTLEAVLAIFFGIIGALALLIITVSGLRYVTSAGDPQKISQAKNGIIYSLVGVAVALAGEAIVVFVVSRL
jgi:hypothetical protein